MHAQKNGVRDTLVTIIEERVRSVAYRDAIILSKLSNTILLWMRDQEVRNKSSCMVSFQKDHLKAKTKKIPKVARCLEKK